MSLSEQMTGDVPSHPGVNDQNLGDIGAASRLPEELRQSIAQDVDIIDRLKWLSRFPTVGATAMIGTGIVGIHEGFSAYFYGVHPLALPLGSGAVLAAGSIAAARIAKPLARRREQKKVAPFLEAQQTIAAHFDGEPVELYRTRGKRKEYQLFWEASPEASTIHTSGLMHRRINDLADLASTADATKLVLPRSTIENFLHGVSDEHIQHTERNAWFAATKRKHIIDIPYGSQELTVISTEALPQVIENTRQAVHEEPLHSLMQLLGSVSPGHPLLKRYFAGIKADTDAARTFEKSLRATLNKSLLDTETALVPLDDGEPIRVKQRQSLFGAVTMSPTGEPTITWRRNSQFGSTEQSDLLTRYRTSLKELESLTELAPHLPRPRVIELCEVAALLTMHDKLRVQGTAENRLVGAHVGQVKPAEVNEASRGLQARIVDHTLSKHPQADATERRGIKIRTLFGRRLGKSALILALSLGAGMGVGAAAEAYANNIAVKAYNIQNDKSLPDDVAEKMAHDVQDNLLYNAINGASNASYWFDHALSSLVLRIAESSNPKYTPKELEKLRFLGGQQSGKLGSDAAVGNVEYGPNRPVWYLTSSGGMNTEGYWVEQTYNNLSKDEAKWSGYKPTQEITADNPHPNNQEYEDKVNQIIQAAPQLPLTALVDPSQPSIRVERLISLGPGLWSNQGSESYDEFGYQSGYHVIPIPILEGTKVAAATLGNNTSARIKALPDGTHVLIVKRPYDGPIKLQYVVVPDPTYELKAKPPVTESGKPLPPNRFDAVWAEHLGQPLPTSPDERLSAEEAYIEGFQYRMQPLSDDRVTEDALKYANEVLDRKQANCNVANTLLVMSNPGQLNYVTGYHNSNTEQHTKSGTTYLASSESHAWAVDTEGTVHDATPGPVSSAEAKYFKEGFGGTYSDPKEARSQTTRRGLETAVVAAGLGIAVWQRKRLRQLPRESHQAYKKARLGVISGRQASTAYHLLNHSLYANDTLSGAALQEAKRSPRMSKSEVVERYNENFVGQPDYKQLTASLKQAGRAAPSATRRSLRRANRIIKLLHSLDSRHPELTKTAL